MAKMQRLVLSLLQNQFFLLLITILCCHHLQINLGDAKEVKCMQRERQALLYFKADLLDSYGMLSSWTSEDCCQWKGIHCNSLTGHVLMLDLHGNENHSQSYISGKISKSLTELQQLKYLNLSWNYFPNSHIPEFLGSLSNLEYLDLSYSYFGGKISSQFGSLSHLKYLDLCGNFLEGSIPYQLGNLSNLHYLGLSGNSFKGSIPSQLAKLSNLQELYLEGYANALKIDDGGKWLSNLTSLTHLHLQSISNLDNSKTWLQMIGKLPKLSELSLSRCSLSDHFILSLSLSQFNSSTSLSVLDLSMNTFTSSMIFRWVSNFSPNLVELDLSSNLLEAPPSKHLGIMMNSLQQLDLSNNMLKGGVLKSVMNMCTLHSLHMFGNNLNEDLPSIIHNLSGGCVIYSLQELDLRSNQITGSFPDLSIFSSLKTLDLSENQLSGKIAEGSRLPPQLESFSAKSNSLEGGMLKLFGSTCSLASLDLSHNKLGEELTVILNNLFGCAKYSLQELDLGENKITGMFVDLSVFLRLKRLNLEGNQLSGKIPEGNKLPSQLEILSMKSNSLEGGIPKSFGNSCTLRSIDLSNNSLNEELPVITYHLSGCAKYSLQYLDLSMNQINGTLPDFSIFPSLKGLYLSENRLNGKIPKDIQFPAQLEELVLNSNSLKGVISDFHFSNMSKLKSLLLSDNSLALIFTQNWVPSFQLRHIELRSCKLGVVFPQWLQTQNKFEYLDISNAEISDIVPEWFWAKLALQVGTYNNIEEINVNVSFNNLKGIIPMFPQKNAYYSISLASNQFEGPIPPFLRGSLFLDLSKNKFSDPLPFLCPNDTVEALYKLDLSNNQLSGRIPNCWSHFKSLTYLDISHNNFSGKVPASMGSLHEVQALLLRNNCLTGRIPFSLSSCTNLEMLDMGENRLYGPIPSWIGSKLQELQVLSMGRNRFFGSLPFQLCYLKHIQLLDLSQNNLAGQIPKCLTNFTSMTQKTSARDYQGRVSTTHLSFNWSYELNAFLMWKGSQQIFKNKELVLLKSIDLSSNHYSGEVPREIENLVELVSLNLSRNNLTGKIPPNIGRLTSLEFLDLSRNQFSGRIPPSVTQIDRLTMLDLSHNHLSGEIPTSTQLQTFSASSYEDNLDLCGRPLEKSCIEEEPTQKPIVKFHEDKDLLFSREFYIIMAYGFVIGFWGIFGLIIVKRSWRDAYFKFLNNLTNKIYDMVAVKLAR